MANQDLSSSLSDEVSCTCDWMRIGVIDFKEGKLQNLFVMSMWVDPKTPEWAIFIVRDISYSPNVLSFVIYKLDDFVLLKCHQ